MRHRLLTLAALCLSLTLGGGITHAADEARARQIMEDTCSACHGLEGESASPLFPRLAGQNAAYMAKQLADYKSGARKNRAMQRMVLDLSEAEFDALGRFFESRTVHAYPVLDPELATVGRYLYANGNTDSGVPSCVSCHGEQGHGSATLPRLAGQHAAYTERQLRAFRKGDRPSAVMQVVAEKLTELETRALAAYVSSLK